MEVVFKDQNERFDYEMQQRIENYKNKEQDANLREEQQRVPSIEDRLKYKERQLRQIDDEKMDRLLKQRRDEKYKIELHAQKMKLA